MNVEQDKTRQQQKTYCMQSIDEYRSIFACLVTSKNKKNGTFHLYLMGCFVVVVVVFFIFYSHFLMISGVQFVRNNITV